LRKELRDGNEESFTTQVDISQVDILEEVISREVILGDDISGDGLPQMISPPHNRFFLKNSGKTTSRCHLATSPP